MQAKIGEKRRADKLGMKGRQILTYLNCKKCNSNKWAIELLTNNNYIITKNKSK